MAKYKSDDPCIICGDINSCLHHIRSRGSGGSDKPHNLMILCLRHHNEIHAKGRDTFSKMHPKAYRWMLRNGWESFNGKWFHEEE